MKTGECLRVYEGHSRAVSPLLFINLSVADRRTERRKSRVKMERKMSTGSRFHSGQHKTLLITGEAVVSEMFIHCPSPNPIGLLTKL